MANLAEQIKHAQMVGFNAILKELDEIVKNMCLKYGGCTLGYCGGEKLDTTNDNYFSARIPEKYRKLTIEHYRSEGLEVTELVTPGGNFKGLKIDL